ncbi:hypothetical protein Tco_1493605 [Tanacetum coccineum]
MHHRSNGLSKDERATFKHFEKCLFYEGRVVDPSYTSDSDIPQVFSVINFNCLLNIGEQICPLFVLHFYKSVRITQNRDRIISIAFIINNQEIVILLTAFAQILRASCEGACMYTVDWSLSVLPNSLDINLTYLTPLDDPVTVSDTIFTQRASVNCRKLSREILKIIIGCVPASNLD